jgi:hypothetical protein
VTPHDQERLLAHASAHCVDALGIHLEPWPSGAQDARHAREIVDLTSPAPRVQRQTSPHPAWADHDKATFPRELAPKSGICPRSHPATMRRDDERQGRRWAVRAVLTGRNDHGPAQHPIVSAIAQSLVPDAGAHKRDQRRSPLAQGRQLRRASRALSLPTPAPASGRIIVVRRRADRVRAEAREDAEWAALEDRARSTALLDRAARACRSRVVHPAASVGAVDREERWEFLRVSWIDEWPACGRTKHGGRSKLEGTRASRPALSQVRIGALACILLARRRT